MHVLKGPRKHFSYVIHMVEMSSWPNFHCQCPQKNHLDDAHGGGGGGSLFKFTFSTTDDPALLEGEYHGATDSV